MGRYTLWLDEIEERHGPVVGAKAMGLARLKRAGFRVPNGFCITTRAFAAALGQPRRTRLAPSLSRHGAGSTRLPQGVRKEIQDSYRGLPRARPVAVRSSGVLEDLPQASFAGQYETFLNVTGFEGLEAAVERCWASVRNERVIAYCRRNRIPADRLRMAVVVQEMIPAEASGVVFTVNPLTGIDTEMMIEAAWGLGEGVVTGKIEPDQFVLDARTKETLRAAIGEKRLKVVAAVRGGRREVPVAPADRKRPCLTTEQLREIATVAREVQILYGAPQDIEFAYFKGRLYLLQARPITTFSFSKDLGEWTTADFRDGGVSAAVCSPFMWSLYDFIWRHSMPDYLKMLGLLKGEINRDEWGKVFFGRPYWNVGAVKRAVSEIPGFVERNFDKDLSIIITYEGDGVKTPVTPMRVLKAIPTLLALNKTYKEQLDFDKRFVLEFERIEEAYQRLPLRALSAEEFLSHYRRLIEKDYFTTETNYFRTIFNQSNSKLDFKVSLDRLNAKGASIAYLNLISGIPRLRTLLPLQDLWRLADRIVKQPGLKERILRMETEKLAKKIASSKRGEASVWSEIKAYIDAYGYHSRTELDITVPRWKEDIPFVVDMLKDFLRTHDKTPDPELLHQKQHQLYLEERRKAEEAFHRTLFSRLDLYSRRTFFRRLDLVRQYAWWREEMRDRSTRMYALIRAYTLEAARRLLESGSLDCEDDIFYLRFSQVFDLLEGRLSAAEARAVIAENRAYNASFRSFKNPNEIGWRWKVEEEPRAEAGAKDTLYGIGCSPGKSRGTVKVIRRIEETHRLDKDDVLVTFFTDPGWTPVLNLVSAVVTETGGLLSHAAIISREYGIPAVLNVKHATALLHDGQTVEVDGDQGVVRLL